MSMPALFLGHGNPMNALERNPWTDAWAKLGRDLPRPRAILAISAHWYVPQLAVTAEARPRTIHDFGGFPQALFDFDYPAPGDTNLATQVQSLLAPLEIRMAEDWGLDHGTWSVLCHVYPRADIPVVQLSIDSSRPAAFHFALGEKLAALRDHDVLIMGSGNLVHNLQSYRWGQRATPPFAWAERFEAEAKQLMSSTDITPLLDYPSLGADAALAVPTPEHFLPLLYVLGARRTGDAIRFPVEGTEGGSISMLSVQVG